MQMIVFANSDETFVRGGDVLKIQIPRVVDVVGLQYHQTILFRDFDSRNATRLRFLVVS